MKIKVTRLEQKMLLSAAKSFRQADKDTIGMNATCEYGDINKDLLKRWDVLIKKLRWTANREKRKR